MATTDDEKIRGHIILNIASLFHDMICVPRENPDGCENEAHILQLEEKIREVGMDHQIAKMFASLATDWYSPKARHPLPLDEFRSLVSQYVPNEKIRENMTILPHFLYAHEFTAFMGHFACEGSMGQHSDRIVRDFFDPKKTIEEKPKVFWYQWSCPDKEDANCLVVFPHAEAEINLLEMLSFYEDFQWETLPRDDLAFFFQNHLRIRASEKKERQLSFMS